MSMHLPPTSSAAFMLLLRLLLATTVLLSGSVVSGGQLATSVSTFGTAVKGRSLAPRTEVELYSYVRPSSNSTMNAAVTAMWFTGQLLWPSFGETTVRVYVDNSSEPLAFALDEGLGVGAGLGGVPWGVDTIGKLAIDGGVYTTLRIPFARALRVTAEMAASESSAMTLYFMLRGLDNYQVVLPGSGLELPTAARLRVAAVHNVTLQPLQWQSLVNVSGSGGMLVLMTQTLRSQNAHCLEGIHYLWTRSGREQQVSSGFEDAYLSGQYFDAGPFRTPLAGMTGEDHWIEPNKLSAYRLFHYDPIIFQEPYGMAWRNGMHDSGNLKAGVTEMTSYVWYYEW